MTVALSLVVATLAGTAGCMHAGTRGGEAPDEVVISGTPTFANGISALLNLKCTVCHSQPRPDIAPTATPGDLDLRLFGLSGTTRGAQDIVLALQAGILQQGAAGFSPMPPDYATPLTPGELAALNTWASSTALPNVGGGTSAADGLLLYAAECQGCHGVHGGGGSASAIAGTDPVTISGAIATAVASVSTMTAWPGLAYLTAASGQGFTDRTAIAAYLASP